MALPHRWCICGVLLCGANDHAPEYLTASVGHRRGTTVGCSGRPAPARRVGSRDLAAPAPHGRRGTSGGTIAAMIARRRMIALTAAYAVALQAILSSFGLLAMAGRSAQEICGPARNLPGSLPTGPDCMMAC